MVKRVGDEGDGANALTESVFLDCVRQGSEWDRKMKEVRDGRSAFRKQAKSKGVELGAMDRAMKMADWQRQEVRDHFDRERQYAEWLGLPIGTQGEIFAGMTDPQRRAQEWHAAGRTARKANKSGAPPEGCTEKYIPFWDRGYKLQEFVWDDETEKAAAVKPAAAAGKGASASRAGRAKKVAGAISPPPATHTGQEADAPKEGAKGPRLVVTEQKDVEEVELPPVDGFGDTGFGKVH